MRPRVKSYGESSTATLSPARMRIKFLRILPETCARTWCLFSSSTRNIAFGSGSITVAMTSIASSLGKLSTFLRHDWNQSFFFNDAFDDGKNRLRDFLDRPRPFDAVIHSALLVVVDQRVRLFFIGTES